MSDTGATRLGGLTRATEAVVDPQSWGRLEWMVSRSIGNSDVLTVGRCTIEPGQQNPPHHHPNSDEVLHVLQGSIEHRVDDDVFPMGPGDTISIPRGSVHNARNIGDGQAVFVIVFDTADRQVVGE